MAKLTVQFIENGCSEVSFLTQLIPTFAKSYRTRNILTTSSGKSPTFGKNTIFGLKMMVKSGLKKYFEISPGKSFLLHRKEDLCKKMEIQ